MRALLALTPLVFATFATFFATPALPCSPALPTLDGTVAPDEGGTLPVNGVLHASLFTDGGGIGASVRGDTEDDAQTRTLDVDEEGGVQRINLVGLAPSTSYTLTLTLDKDIAFTEEDLARDVHFVTNEGADNTAPTLEGDAVVVVEHQSGPNPFDLGGFSGCSLPVETNHVTVTAPAAEDDVGVAGIKLFRVDDNGGRELRRFALGGASLTTTEPASGDYTYELVAVDLAGNESAPLPVAVAVSGCSAAGAGTPALGVALALLLRRRRR